MNPLHNQVLRLTAFTAILIGGCTAQDTFKKLTGPSPQEQVAMALDPNDADRRREGVILLSNARWGSDEVYMKSYAMMAARDSDPTVRSACIRALGKAGNMNYQKAVVDALVDPSDAVRLDAAVVLDKMPGPDAVGPLRKAAVADPSMDVRAACAHALRHYRLSDVIVTLVQCLGEEPFNLRYEAHASLVEIVGSDLGYDPMEWKAVRDSSKPPTPAPPAARPWWDWMGVTAKKEPPANVPATAPAARPAPASAPAAVAAASQPANP